MKKPHLSDFNLSEESLKEQRRKRSQLRFLIIILSIAIGIANLRFWIWSNSVIGGWGILELILTYYGFVPRILCGLVLDAVVGKMFSKNGFSKGVYTFAQGKSIMLWNTNCLIEMQKELDK